VTDPIPAEQEELRRALQTVKSDDPREAEALRWAVEVLASPIEDVRDLDPRWHLSNYEILMAMSDFAVVRAAGLIAAKLGCDAQQHLGRVSATKPTRQS